MNSGQVYTKTTKVWLRVILIIFKVLGFVPFSINVTTLKCTISAKGFIYNIVLIIWCLMIIYFCTPFFYGEASTVDAVFEIFLFTSSYGSLIIILLKSAFQQRKFMWIFNRLVYVERRLIAKFSNTTYQHNETCEQILIFIIYFSSVIILLITLLLRTDDYLQWESLFVIVYFCLGCCLIQYTFILIRLEKYIKVINKSLKLMANSALEEQQYFVVRTTAWRSSITRNLILIREAHRVLYEIATLLADIYSFNALLVILIYFIDLTYSTYYFVMANISLTSSFIPMVNDGFWIVTNSIPILAVTCSVHRLLYQVFINLYDKLCKIPNLSI